MPTQPKRPIDVLHGALDARVIVHIRGDREYRGVLEGYDHPHLNLVVRDAEEIHHPGRPEEKTTRRDLVIIRGDNIVYVSP